MSMGSVIGLLGLSGILLGAAVYVYNRYRRIRKLKGELLDLTSDFKAKIEENAKRAKKEAESKAITSANEAIRGTNETLEIKTIELDAYLNNKRDLH